MTLTIGELREFIEDMDNDIEVVLETIIVGEKSYCSEVDMIYSTNNYIDKELLILSPAEVSIE